MHDAAEATRTSPDAKSARAVPEQETAHILFMDIVGYSKLPVKSQCVVQDVLRQVVQDTPEYQEAREREEHSEDLLICRPSGDGMSLLFFGSPLAPVRCAIQITEALRSHCFIKLRMGIHSGPVRRVPDINAHADVAGAGIVVAQRVMDQGDAGHILLSGDSKAAFENVQEYSYPMGHMFLSDLGNCVVKHGHSVRVFSLRDRQYGKPAFGNPIVPKKLRPDDPVIVLTPPPPPLLVSILNSLKIAAGGILLILLVRGVCQFAAPELYSRVATIGTPATAQAKSAPPPAAPVPEAKRADVPASDQVPVPNLMRMRFGRAQALAARCGLVLSAHDRYGGPIAAVPTDLTLDKQFPPAGTRVDADSSVYVRVRRTAHVARAQKARPDPETDTPPENTEDNSQPPPADPDTPPPGDNDGTDAPPPDAPAQNASDNAPPPALQSIAGAATHTGRDTPAPLKPVDTDKPADTGPHTETASAKPQGGG